jgi:hypothetical protein
MKQPPTFFRSDGSMHVTIPCKAVRWIDFLANSRLVNSQKGGWDFKTTWKTEGLQQLLDAEFLGQWTDTSLDDSKTYPRPRPNDFKLGREFTSERTAAAALCDPRRIAYCPENSLNARLFQNYGIPPSGDRTRCDDNPFSGPLLAYEVPLCDDSDGQLKIDLLACDLTREQLEIIELKQAANTGNSPMMALVEGICYGLQLWRCRKAFRVESEGLALPMKAKEFALKPAHFKTLNITIAAPDEYWIYWQCTGDQAKEVMKKMEQILAKVSEAQKLRGTALKLRPFCTIKSEHLQA